MTQDDRIKTEVEQLKRDGAPRRLVLQTSLPQRTQDVWLSVRDSDFIVIESDVAPVAENFRPPEMDALTLYVDGGILKAVAVLPVETTVELVIRHIRHLADRADYLEYGITDGGESTLADRRLEAAAARRRDADIM